MSKRVRVLGYARVSTHGQADHGTSIETQVAKIRGYCDLHDLELVDVVTDPGYSAATLDRPGIQRVIAELRARHVDGVVVLKLDRLSRNVADIDRLVSDLFSGKRARRLLTVDGSTDTSTAAGRMVINLMSSVASWEREAIGERVAVAKAHLKAQGRFLGGPCAPLGYAVVDGALVEVADEMVVVREVRRLHATGMSMRAIAGTLAERGVTLRGAISVGKVQRACAAATVA